MGRHKNSGYKNGNPKKASEFICLHCLRKNRVTDGMQRFGHDREKNHIKNIMCISPECRDMDSTQNLEVRWCDDYEKSMEKAKRIRSLYYTDPVPTENR